MHIANLNAHEHHTYQLVNLCDGMAQLYSTIMLDANLNAHEHKAFYNILKMTQLMECDSVHSTIEMSKKNVDVYAS